MKITNANSVNFSQNKLNVQIQKEQESKELKKAPNDTYEKSKPQDKKFTYDKTTIDQLKMDADQHYQNLRRMVQELLQRQGKSFNELDSHTKINVDETTRSEAQKLVSEDGPLGIEAMSDRIVDFAKAISGGDKTKLATLKDAINKGFSEAEKVLGELPEISQKTHDRIMEKLDIWENEK